MVYNPRTLPSLLLLLSAIHCYGLDVVGMNGINFEIPSDHFFKTSALEFQIGLFETTFYVETPPIVSFAFAAKDKYNNGKFNLSSSLLYSYLLRFPLSLFCDSMKIGKKIACASLLPVTLANSSIHYAPAGAGNIIQSENEVMTGSIFIKSSIEPFIFRSTKWISFSPGAGLALLNNYTKSFWTLTMQLKIGVNYCFDYFFNKRTEKRPSVFVKFSYLGLN